MKTPRPPASLPRLLLAVATGWAVLVAIIAAAVLGWRMTYLPAMTIANYLFPIAEEVSK